MVSSPWTLYLRKGGNTGFFSSFHLKIIFSAYCISMNRLQKFANRGLQRTLSVLFFTIPLIYAWLYVPEIQTTLADITQFFWVLNFAGFEKIKVFFFVGLVTLATIFFLWSQRGTKKHLVILSLFMVWTLFSYLINSEINPYFWFGNMEKFHGWYLYLSLLMLWIILSTSTHKENKRYLTISILSSGLVCLYAFFQYRGMDPLATAYSTRLDLTRVFSTLWNPNYLAGYVLMLLPLVEEKVFSKGAKKDRLWYGILLGWLILCLIGTKSLIGIAVFIGYLSYILLYKYLPLKQTTRHIFLATTLGVIVVAGIYIITQYGEQILEIQKIKGFIARYFLWETGIRALFGDIRNTLFGYGPDGFLPVSEIFRSRELSIFEDPAFRIDRSHNVWIDILLHFGIPMGGFLIYSIFYPWKQLPISHKETLILFSIFFFFNIPVLVHFILLLQILILAKETEKISSLSHS